MKSRIKQTIGAKGRSARRKLAGLISSPPPVVNTPQTPVGFEHVAHHGFSAHGEDIVSLSWVLRSGIKPKDVRYLDVGAAEPSYLSNTYLLYTLGAKGVLVEPDPDSAKKLRKTRPRDTVVEAGAAFDKQKIATYHRFNESVFNTFSEEQAKIVQKQSKTWGKGREVKLIETKKIPLISLNEIIKKQLAGKAPNFLTVDAEGVDWKILTSINFKKYRPDVICFEAIIGQRDCDKLFLPLGYTLVCRTPDNLIYAQIGGL